MRILAALFTAAALLGSPAVASTVSATSSGDGMRRLTFDVFLDDRAIGYQRFDLTRSADGIRLETQAKFKVKVLMITAFAYDHRNSELWREGCLHAIDSRTDSNGKRYAVSGRARGTAFLLETKTGERVLGNCVASFAYWDKDVLLQSQRLLNSQTGEYLPVRIDSLGNDRLRIGQRELRVERYAIRGKGLDITLAYTAGGGDWVALDSRLEGGRTLRYRRQAGEVQVSAGISPVRIDGTGGVQ